jgi:methanogenic corrinoid protein MtbC1
MTIKEAVVKGAMEGIQPLIKKALEKGSDADSILKELIDGMWVVGDLFEKKEYYIPETLLSAHTMKLGLLTWWQCFWRLQVLRSTTLEEMCRQTFFWIKQGN